MTHGTLTDRTFALPKGWSGSASFSEDGTYRYVLARHWRDVFTPMFEGLRAVEQPPYLACIGTNPSAAEALRDDQTVRLLCNLARRRGYYGLTMLNAYAFRATSPAELKEHGYPVGPDNDEVIRSIITTYQYDVLACWGSIPTGRHGDLRELLRERAAKLGQRPSWCIALTKGGQPVHPLRQRMDEEWVDLPL
jgi:hypothetical protein